MMWNMENMCVCLRIICILILVKNVYLTDKIHFSKWIKMDDNFSGDIFIFETVLGNGLEFCIESCKAKKMCSYINFNVKANMCSLIGTKSESTPISNTLETKEGFVFGRKTDWNLGMYEKCLDCELFGVCKPHGTNDDEYAHCQHSGCGPPESKMWADLNGNMFTVGDKAEYKCSPGYKDAHGTAAFPISCQMSGVWTQANILCVPENTAVKVFNNSVYFHSNEKKNWTDAQIFCKKFGGYLAVINTEYIFNETTMLLKSIKEQDIWLGGNDREKEGEWMWSDDTHLNSGMTKWSKPNPDNAGGKEHCLVIRHFRSRNNWNDATCFSPFSFLCEIKV